ncbi:DUF2075 domain-containing protein [Thalassolituus sp. LLYu03]|uniref:DUF2075 domain-containing protein n=1 Tax=Thalassolituus sp. LLYu03 TaxID=3421656 RepID=UPI003D2A7EBC
MINRSYFSARIDSFLQFSVDEIIGKLTEYHTQDIVFQQRNAWKEQIEILQSQLEAYEDGYIHFEFLIPRMGKRADVVVFVRGVIFVLEFKVGSKAFFRGDALQTLSYAYDLKNFHQGSEQRVIVPILVATSAKKSDFSLDVDDQLVAGIVESSGENIGRIIEAALVKFDPLSSSTSDYNAWINSSYKPSPTIIQAAQALYANHRVEEISRTEAGVENLSVTTKKIQEIIHQTRINKQKSICFVTGVPGAGKTLVGLDVATRSDRGSESAVFLSGNGPLVAVLREALARDKRKRNPDCKADDAKREVAAYIQNIHHFRDDALADSGAPNEKVVIFDEAQRAWDLNATKKFMESKRGQRNFNQSEPQFLINVMNRHEDWCVVIVLIGGGQEINRGEAGVVGWFEAISEHPEWCVYYADQLTDKSYSGASSDGYSSSSNWLKLEELHLKTSLRSFRADSVSSFIHSLIQNEPKRARKEADDFKAKYPIKITRDLDVAKAWLKSKAKALESKGMLSSSSGKRLRATGFFAPDSLVPEKWFLSEQDDVRSSNILEEAATEFVVQGLELDWCIVGWDADYRYQNGQFEHWNFKGSKWQRRNQDEVKRHLENAYRVILTRARQGMVIYVPVGSDDDETRLPAHYDETYRYLLACGFDELAN